jgi:hypothetical protein
MHSDRNRQTDPSSHCPKQKQKQKQNKTIEPTPFQTPYLPTNKPQESGKRHRFVSQKTQEAERESPKKKKTWRTKKPPKNISFPLKNKGKKKRKLHNHGNKKPR